MLKQKIFSTRHAWDFRDVPGVSKKCQEDYTVFLHGLNNFELWAVKSESNFEDSVKCVDNFSNSRNLLFEINLKFKVIHTD